MDLTDQHYNSFQLMLEGKKSQQFCDNTQLEHKILVKSNTRFAVNIYKSTKTTKMTAFVSANIFPEFP